MGAGRPACRRDLDLQDGSVKRDDWAIPNWYDPTRPAEPEERETTEGLVKQHPPEPCQLPDPPTTWPSPPMIL